MAEDDTGTLAHLGHAIYAQLEKIAALAPPPPSESNIFQTWTSVINECDRFKIWSTSTGLLIPGHGSLDYRVREADTLAHTFRSFLLDLLENFEDVLACHLPNALDMQLDDSSVQNGNEIDDDHEGDNDNHDNDNVSDILLDSIKDVIDRLFRLATKLRSPETRLRSSRAQNFVKLEDGVDLFKCFYKYDLDFVSSIFRSYQGGPAIVSDFHRMHSLHASSETKYDDAMSTYLIERLALANVARRRQFAYWEHHRLKLDKHTAAAIAVRQTSDPSLTDSNLPTPLNLQSMNLGNALTISTATQLLRSTQTFDDLASIASVSQYIPTSVAESGDLVIFPPMPKVAIDAKFFECPYCFTTCSKKILRTSAWQAHLIHDLRPYMCTYRHCRIPGQLFDTRADWIQHEAENHATTWTCPLHSDEVFDDLAAFRMHASDGHVQNAIIERGLQESVAAKSASSADRSCPICSVFILPTSQLYDHIAAHLERLAIFSLPKHADSSEADHSSRASNEANGEQDSRTSHRGSDLSFASVPPSIDSKNSLLEQIVDSTSLPVTDVLELKDGEVDTVGEEQELITELATKEEQLGQDHPSTLSTIKKLADLYIEQYRVDDAERMLARALAGRQRIPDPDQRSTHDVMRSLGNVYWFQGKYEQAEEMYVKALAGEDRVPELEHAFFVGVWGELAHLYEWQGNHGQAAEVHRQILNLQIKLLGQAHPDTITSMYDLAVGLRRHGALTQARQLLQETIELRTRALGTENTATLMSMHELGEVLTLEEKLEQAEQLYKSVIELSQRLLESGNIITKSSMARLAEVLGRQDKFEQEERIREELLELERAETGWGSETKIINMKALANVLLRHGKLQRAEVMYRETFQRQKSILGPDDARLADTKKALANVLRQQGEHDEADEFDPPQPATSPPAAIQLVESSAPLEKIQALYNHFYTVLEPQIELFLRSLPPDQEDRARESRRLSELIQLEILDKDDVIVDEGFEQLTYETRLLKKELHADVGEFLAGLKTALTHDGTSQEAAGAIANTTDHSKPSYLILRLRLRGTRRRMIVTPDIDFNTLYARADAKLAGGSGYLQIFSWDKDNNKTFINSDRALSEALRHLKSTCEHNEDADFVTRLDYN